MTKYEDQLARCVELSESLEMLKAKTDSTRVELREAVQEMGPTVSPVQVGQRFIPGLHRLEYSGDDGSWLGAARRKNTWEVKSLGARIRRGQMWDETPGEWMIDWEVVAVMVRKDGTAGKVENTFRAPAFYIPKSWKILEEGG